MALYVSMFGEVKIAVRRNASGMVSIDLIDPSGATVTVHVGDRDEAMRFVDRLSAAVDAAAVAEGVTAHVG